MTPKDEQNARIQERQRYLDLLDADFQLRQIQINMLRMNGQLEDWLKSAAQMQPTTASPHKPLIETLLIQLPPIHPRTTVETHKNPQTPWQNGKLVD